MSSSNHVRNTGNNITGRSSCDFAGSAGACSQTRLPRPRRALPDALPIAHRRGKVQVAEGGPENIYNFTIVSPALVAFVRVKFIPRILAAPADILADFRDAIVRLRAIVQAGVISRELWLRSKHGTWRFFRVTKEGLEEIDEHGTALAGAVSEST